MQRGPDARLKGRAARIDRNFVECREIAGEIGAEPRCDTERVLRAFRRNLAEPLADLLHLPNLATQARQTVMSLAEEIAGVRGVDAGPLRFSRYTEGLTILLVGINGRYKIHGGVRIAGMDAH